MKTTYEHMTDRHWEILQRIALGEELTCHAGQYRGGVWMIGTTKYNGHHVRYLTARYLTKKDKWTVNDDGKEALRHCPDEFRYVGEEVVKPITVLRYRTVAHYRPLKSKVEKFRKLLRGCWDDFPVNEKTKEDLLLALRAWRQSRPGRGKKRG